MNFNINFNIRLTKYIVHLLVKIKRTLIIKMPGATVKKRKIFQRLLQVWCITQIDQNLKKSECTGNFLHSLSIEKCKSLHGFKIDGSFQLQSKLVI